MAVPADETLKTLDAVIPRLIALRNSLSGEASPALRSEPWGPHINAPVWPWFTAGWLLGALFVLLFLMAWSYA